MFNYQSCTLEELVVHVKTNSRGAITQAKRYYLAKGEEGVVQLIDKARLVARRDAAIARAERLALEVGV